MWYSTGGPPEAGQIQAVARVRLQYSGDDSGSRPSDTAMMTQPDKKGSSLVPVDAQPLVPIDAQPLAAREPSDITALRRDDLSALVTSQQRVAKPNQMVAASLLGGVATTGSLLALSEWLHWAPIAAPMAFVAGFAVLGGIQVKMWRSERKRLAPFTFDCPSCGLAIINGVPASEDWRRAELVIATGCCPGCGAKIVAD
jgi:hypothetical protein